MVAVRRETESERRTNTPETQDELSLIEALRAGDEAAFMALVETYHASLVRLAMVYVGDRAVAEEVAQETWVGVLKGLDRFERRSSLKTWIFRILTNRAMTRGQREGRSLPFSALWNPNGDTAPPAVDPDRFLPPDDPHWPGHWASVPGGWDEIPEERLLAQETLAVVQSAIDRLAPGQREVIILRDVQGWTSAEVCNVLALSETNQRVLLHRARSKVRHALEQYINE